MKPSTPARWPGALRYRFTAGAAALGATAAGAYAHFFGCDGSCPITSSVWRAALYGALVGALAGWPSRDHAPRSGAGEGERT